ncbi:4-hydroxy-tetrahydrodipicolinate reductase [Meridianimarinicoccus sp. MJW13]|uniref:4-hydroxy-tetrahydrodipicolinate reductase n=1 Tax=Meridianimarinicoccus sp. MJW13 TaxID=2720031 RepID=UPI001867051E|nr:4-hydroxy-tetrahydrodipicolinate reductase [Fluviibacterium sp. MJW13]
MSESCAIVVMGVSGRMGRMLVQTVQDNPKTHLSGAVERPGHDWIGRDLGEAMGGAATGVVVTGDAAAALDRADAVIDFTAPAATVALAQLAADKGVVHVIGTTGMTEADIAAVDAVTDRGVVVRAGNMSLGVNLLVQLTRQVAAALDEDYDIEVVEGHHRHKVDAPSGTALMLGQAAADGRGVDLEQASDRGRDGITGPRERGKIGFHAIRGGDIIGEHDVLFAADGERITLRHVASDRSVFARGAVKAALWGQGKVPGHYSMLDVLGLG